MHRIGISAQQAANMQRPCRAAVGRRQRIAGIFAGNVVLNGHLFDFFFRYCARKFQCDIRVRGDVFRAACDIDIFALGAAAFEPVIGKVKQRVVYVYAVVFVRTVTECVAQLGAREV